jgi:hypothetical protein
VQVSDRAFDKWRSRLDVENAAPLHELQVAADSTAGLLAGIEVLHHEGFSLWTITVLPNNDPSEDEVTASCELHDQDDRLLVFWAVFLGTSTDWSSDDFYAPPYDQADSFMPTLGRVWDETKVRFLACIARNIRP